MQKIKFKDINNMKFTPGKEYEFEFDGFHCEITKSTFPGGYFVILLFTNGVPLFRSCALQRDIEKMLKELKAESKVFVN